MVFIPPYVLSKYISFKQNSLSFSFLSLFRIFYLFLFITKCKHVKIHALKITNQPFMSLDDYCHYCH